MTENGKPKYFTLMEELKEEILSGQIQPGEKLPSENQLTEKYSLSRHTVRKAIALLEREGYVEAYHGKGTFCSEKMRHMKKSRNIAVVTTYISDYIFPRLIQGMDKYPVRAGIQHYSEKYGKQPSEGSQMSGGCFCRRRLRD